MNFVKNIFYVVIENCILVKACFSASKPSQQRHYGAQLTKHVFRAGFFETFDVMAD